MIEFPCPHCGFMLEFGDSAAGRSAKCPKCREKLVVPEFGLLPREQAESIVRQVAEKHRAKGILRRLGRFLDSHLANARASFAKEMSSGEIPLGLIDTSFRTNGKSGFLVTNQGLYSSRLRQLILLDAIQKVSCTSTSFLCQGLVGLSLAIWILLFHLILPYPIWFPLDIGMFILIMMLNQHFKSCLIVNGLVVYRGQRPLRSDFWMDLLTTLGSAARRVQEGGWPGLGAKEVGQDILTEGPQLSPSFTPRPRKRVNRPVVLSLLFLLFTLLVVEESFLGLIWDKVLPPRTVVLNWYTAERLATIGRSEAVKLPAGPQGEEQIFLVVEVQIPGRALALRKTNSGYQATIQANQLLLRGSNGESVAPAFSTTPDDFTRTEWSLSGMPKWRLLGMGPSMTWKTAYPMVKTEVEQHTWEVQYRNYPCSPLTGEIRGLGTSGLPVEPSSGPSFFPLAPPKPVQPPPLNP